MKIRLFYHSLLSDWNNGNAHFLRGIARELQSRGHDVLVYEPADAWSLQNLRADYGDGPLRRFHDVYPTLDSVPYDLATFDLEPAVADADLVLVHEWNAPELVKRIGASRRQHDFVLLFHDTHHRLVTDPQSMRALDLTGYDGVLAYGNALRERYLSEALVERAWTWHEAADTRVFRPRASAPLSGDLVWIGNWGDGERTEELYEFLIEPVRALGLKARVHGVRYPDHAIAALARAGIEYGGWVPNFDVPLVFSQFKVTVHVPRRPYVQALPGIPTIRPFEALACGIPLICSPWSDREELFTPGKDFLLARDGREMTELLRRLLADEAKRWALASHGVDTILSRHTCAHRVDELLSIHARVWAETRATGCVPGPPQLATPTARC
ncbi:MAG TPA: glycosyltransferase [Opitutaceae bacterium]